MSRKAKGSVEITVVVRGRAAATAAAAATEAEEEEDEDDGYSDDEEEEEEEDDDDDDADEEEEEEEEADAEDEEDASYVPFEGSWVRELEKAKEDEKELQRLRRRAPGGGGGGGGGVSKMHRGDALMAYRRLCRAHSKLREWEALEGAATKGLEVCASYSQEAQGESARIVEWKRSFHKYRDLSWRERSEDKPKPTRLYFPKVREILDAISAGQADPNRVVLRPHGVFSNSNLLQEAALVGDLRYMEEILARGAAVDFPFIGEVQEGRYRPPVVAPSDATALVAVCCNLVLAFSEHHPALELGRARWSTVWWGGELCMSLLCAIQLVQLGADPTRTLNVSNSRDDLFMRVARSAGLDGMTALDLVRLLDPAEFAGLTELVKLMESRVRCSAVGRANSDYCRCGSWLHWRTCHGGGTRGESTVGGQPPPLHFCVLPEMGNAVAYRVAPRAKCPCHQTTLTHYECCWNDPTKPPMYLVDTTGQVVTVERMVPNWPSGRVVEYLDESGDRQRPTADPFGPFVDASAASLLWWPPPSRFRELFAGEGPKSKWKSWDPDVYAKCVRRLRSHLFLWKDLHSNLDESELLERTAMWNEALERYCYDLELVGDERRRVIAKHRANPCAPCGRVGCDAFEKEVREFPRCSRCRSIAYCGRACQKLDWAVHRKVCGSVSRTEPI